MQFNYTFDATQHAPEQGSGGHPEGKFPATVISTALVPIKDDADGRPRFVVEFETSSGKIKNGYNLWSANQQASDISHKQLSALSHATGVFKLDMMNEGAALRGARCMIEVGKQKNSDYVEVKRVYDVNGNEPGKTMQPAQTQSAPAPAWGNQPAQPQAQPAAGPSWGAPQPAQQPAPATAAPPWSQGPATAAPPWQK